MLKLGPAKVTGMANQLGVTAKFDPPHASDVLGTGLVSVQDMAAAYSTFANQGVQITPRLLVRVERADGSLVEEFRPQPKPVLTAQQSSLVTYCLQQVVKDGTGKAAAFGPDLAGKTGTTQQNADAWFAGYAPKLTAAVWMGDPNGSKPMTSVHGQTVQGGNIPVQMWRAFMTVALQGTDPGTFVPPTDIKVGNDVNPELTTAIPPTTDPTQTTEPQRTTEPRRGRRRPPRTTPTTKPRVPTPSFPTLPKFPPRFPPTSAPGG
jgi:membrane peptidoglycan carboxypeptidase